MEDLKELYQQVILDHNKHPQNYGRLENANRTAEGYNPLCGDRVQLFLQVDEGLIKDIRFLGSGCAISKASASVMTTELKGRTITEAEELFRRFQSLITSDIHHAVDAKDFGKLAVFSGLREFPMRIKCASLSWHAMMSALNQSGKAVSTEV
jgi:nitrogen fixation NifU-like protein